MKILKKTAGLWLLILLPVAACNDNAPTWEDPEAKAYPAVITAQGFGMDEDSEGVTYTQGETIGVFMMENGTDNMVLPYGNLRYYANRYDDEDYFLPGNNDSIPYFPPTGEKRDISAYYPRTVTLADSLVNLHLVERYEYASSLLWARVNGLDKDNRIAALALRPALTLLTFSLRGGMGITMDDLEGVIVTMKGIPVSGHFNAVNGYTHVNRNILIDLTVPESTTSTRADADEREGETIDFATFVLPSSTTQGYQMQVEVPNLGQTYTIDIPAKTEQFESSMEYLFDIEITPQGMDVDLQTSPITNWGNNGSISGETEDM